VDAVRNEMADKLAKLGPECPFIAPHAACDMSVAAAKKAVWETLRSRNGTHTRTLCQKKQGAAKIKQKPVTVGG
jgi:hypothetical protein